MPTKGRAGQRPRRQQEARQRQQQRTPEAAVGWFLVWVNREKSPKTLVNYTATLSKLQAEFGSDLFLLTPRNIEDWLFRPRKGGKQGSVNTRRAEVITLKSFYSFCERSGVVQAVDNPMRQVKMPAEPKRVAAKGVPRSTINGIVKECSEPWKLLVLVLLADAGLRANEVCTVPPEALKTAGTSSYLQLVGKGSKERIVPVSKRLVALWKAQAGQVGAGTPVCRSATGHVLSNTRIWQVAVDAGLNAGFADMHPHRWRHSWACWLYYEKNVHLTKVQRLLGHSSVVTTMRYLGVHDHELIELGGLFDE